MRKRLLLLTLVFALFLHSCNTSSSKDKDKTTTSNVISSEPSTEELPSEAESSDPVDSSEPPSEVESSDPIDTSEPPSEPPSESSSEEDVDPVDPDIATVAAAKASLTLSNTTNLTSDITLPHQGAKLTNISWHSSHPNSIEINVLQTGVVIGRVHQQQNAVSGITLTATISKGVVSDTKAFTASVAALPVEPDPDPDGEFNVETIATKRVWAKVTSATWNSNAETYIHYFGGTSPETVWPGIPLLSDTLNDAYYFDLPEDITGYMFTRVDIDGNYLNAKTADLSYANSTGQIYTVTGSVSGSGEQTIAGSYAAFTAQTTAIVADFVAIMNNVSALNNFAAAVRELNYYYHGLTTFERNQFDNVTLSDSVKGTARIANLIATHNLATTPSSTFTTLLNSDRDSLSLPASVSANFDLPKAAANGSLLAWSSSNANIIKVVGYRALVTPPASATTVNLSATLKLFNATVVRQLSVSVVRDQTTQTVTVTWTVNIPSAIPSGRTLTMGSDQNAWTPSNTTWGTVTRVSDTQYRFVKEFVKTGSADTFLMSYKWVLYSASDAGDQWYGVELIDNNANRNETISFASATQSFTDTVSSWEHLGGGNDGGGTTPIGQGNLTVTNVNGRTIRIYTPSGYNASDTSKKYPVIYLHDGQNLFDRATSFAGEWEVDEAIEGLMASKGWSGAIAVGIDNTGNRMGEYMYPTGYISYSGTTPVGDVYMDRIVNQIKPYVDSNYNTLTDRANTVIGGSSMGGLISFFGGLHRLSTFGTILAFSSSTQLVSNPATNIPNTLRSLDANLLANTKFFLYVGTSGDGDQNHPETYQGYLIAAGVPSANVQTYKGQGYGHTESAWAKHFPYALSWAMGYGI